MKDAALEEAREELDGLRARGESLGPAPISGIILLILTVKIEISSSIFGSFFFSRAFFFRGWWC